MSYSEDAVRAKLSALNETQDSIVSAAQWVLFHRRYADKTAQLWLERLKESNPPKRVNLIYLANEVAQQSKARGKLDFTNAFSTILPEATAAAVTGANNDVQTKVKRVVEVWRQRQIFEPSVQDAIEARIADAEKQRPSGSKKALGGSLFSSEASVPAEIQAVVATQVALSKANLNMTSLVQTAQKDRAALNSSNEASKPPPRVHAAQLGAVVKALTKAEAAVSESLSKRRELIEGLEKLISDNRKTLVEEESSHVSLMSQLEETELRRRSAEDSILVGASTSDVNPPGDADTLSGDPDAIERPELESFTPPPVEPLSPPPAPMPEAAPSMAIATPETEPMVSTTPDGSPPPSNTTSAGPSNENGTTNNASDIAAVAASNAIPASSIPLNGTRTAPLQDAGSNRGVKRRRSEQDDFPQFGFGDNALEGLDDEVVSMLG